MVFRAIRSHMDLEKFKESDTCKEYLNFIKLCSVAVAGVKISDSIDVSPSVMKFVNFFERLLLLVSEIPPIKQPMRFGNKAFRTWHAKVLKVVVHAFDLIIDSMTTTIYLYLG